MEKLRSLEALVLVKNTSYKFAYAFSPPFKMAYPDQKHQSIWGTLNSGDLRAYKPA